MQNIKLLFKPFVQAIGVFILILAINVDGASQKFASLVGLELGYKRAGVSGKIALSEKNYVEGKFALFTPEPNTSLGAGAAFHRHIMLNEGQTTQLYFGPSVKGVIGDSQAMGLGVDLGITFLFKKVNIGFDLNPTYFFDDLLKFEPIYGLHLRWVNY